MKLFELNKQTYEVEIAPEAISIEVFNRIIKRDKSKHKEQAKRELAFIYHYCDTRSDYIGMDDGTKKERIFKNLAFPEGSYIDSLIEEAVEYYLSFKTPIESLYESALISAKAIEDYLKTSKALLEERDDNGKVVTDIAKLTASLEKLPKIMANLKAAEKELIKEKTDNEGRKKGSRTMNMFEDGI